MSKEKQTAGKTATTGAATRKGDTNKINGEAQADMATPRIAADAVYTVEGTNLMALMGAARCEEQGHVTEGILRDLEGVALPDAKREELRERASSNLSIGRATLKALIGELRPETGTKRKAVAAGKKLADRMAKAQVERLAAAWEESPHVRRSYVVLRPETLAGLDAIAARLGVKTRSKTLARVLSKEVNAPIVAEVEEDEIGAEAILPKYNIAATAYIGGKGWKAFRTLGKRRRQDADELVEAAINKARLLSAIAVGEAKRAKSKAQAANRPA